MKKLVVGFDVSPLYTGHKVRGIGFYTKRLLSGLEKEKNLKIVQIEKKADLKTKKFDVLHIPYFSPFIVSLPPFFKKPLLVTVHDLIPIKYPQLYPAGARGKIKWQIQKRLLKKAKIIFTDSEASKKDIASIVGFPEERILVTLLAAGEQFGKIAKTNPILERVRKKFSLPEKFVLYVGDINRNKNIPALVKACQQLDVVLLVVGKQAISQQYDKSHPENKDLVFLQHAARKDKKILLAGYLDDKEIVAIYNLATVYVQPSIDEGFGLPVLEAMASGCPVICSKNGSLPEVAGNAAILVDPSTKGIKKAIKDVLADKKKRDILSKLGQNRAKTFSWEKTAKETIKGYKMAEKTSSPSR